MRSPLAAFPLMPSVICSKGTTGPQGPLGPPGPPGIPVSSTSTWIFALSFIMALVNPSIYAALSTGRSGTEGIQGIKCKSSFHPLHVFRCMKIWKYVFDHFCNYGNCGLFLLSGFSRSEGRPWIDWTTWTPCKPHAHSL